MTNENTVLVEAPALQRQDAFHSGYSSGFKPRLIDFSGAEGEDFRHFAELLESYLAVSNITNDARKIIILRAQLRTAKSYFDNALKSEDYGSELTYEGANDILRNRYVTPDFINCYTIAFNELHQGKYEHPRMFLGRLQEAAELTELNNPESQIRTRFQVGLLPEIRKFCIMNSAATFKDYLTKADGWWNAEKPL